MNNRQAIAVLVTTSTVTFEDVACECGAALRVTSAEADDEGNLSVKVRRHDCSKRSKGR